jgi:hypothetical protein
LCLVVPGRSFLSGHGDGRTTKVTAAVVAKDPAATVTAVRKEADGSSDVVGTKNGATVTLDVSADLATDTLHPRVSRTAVPTAPTTHPTDLRSGKPYAARFGDVHPAITCMPQVTSRRIGARAR